MERSNGILILAIWFGLLTGLGEAVLLGIQKFRMGQVIRFGPNIVWMAPFADAVLFLIVGSIIILIGRLSGRLSKGLNRLALGILAFLAFLSGFYMYYPLQTYAKVLLAAGLAVQTVRLVERWPVVFHSFVRRSVPWIAGFVIVVGVGMYGWSWFRYERTVAQLPAAPANSPNVLLIVLDTVRAKSLSLYGHQRQTTPNLERWAQTGVVFDNAMSTAPWTLPSHGSMFTGRWPHELSADWKAAIDGKHETIAEFLGARGYLTAGFVANTQYCGYEFGLARGFARYEDYVVSPQELLISSVLGRSIANDTWTRQILRYWDNIPRRSAAQINQQLLDWIGSAKDRPFFAFVNYFDAHASYLPPKPYDEMFGPDLPRGNERMAQELRHSTFSEWRTRSPQEIEVELNMYEGSIAYLDYELNRLFNELQRRGVLQNTLVIVTSDHGEQFGEHNFYVHSNSLYEPLLHVPLMVWFPKSIPGGKRIAGRVSLRDLPATIVDVTGLSDGNAFPGSSLSRHWSSDTPIDELAEAPILAEVRQADWAKEWYPTFKGDLQAIMDDRHKYIKNGDGSEELYSSGEDPLEQRNLASVESARPILERFRMKLEAFVAKN